METTSPIQFSLWLSLQRSRWKELSWISIGNHWQNFNVPFLIFLFLGVKAKMPSGLPTNILSLLPVVEKTRQLIQIHFNILQIIFLLISTLAVCQMYKAALLVLFMGWILSHSTTTGCPTKNDTLFWRAVAPLNFELGIKVGGVLESSGPQLFKTVPTFEFWPSRSWDIWG